MISAYGAPLGSARLRSQASDFRVTETLSFIPSGHGEHCLLQVEKCGATTPEVVAQLAKHLGVAKRALSYAGLKDRHAQTVQWFSAHLPGGQRVVEPGPVADGVVIRAVTFNQRKLRRGALRANHFVLTLRALDAPRREVEQRLATVVRCGVPNYFGPQRFGRDGGNLEQARAWLLDGANVRSRTLRGLLLSTVRSELFNRLLARRVAAGSWATLCSGDRAGLDGRSSHFAVDTLNEALLRRAALGDLHPTGPLAGGGGDGDGPTGAVAELEAEVLAEEFDLIAALVREGVRADRRPLRVMPRKLVWRWSATDCLELSFLLPPGAYATALIAELFDVGEWF